MQGNQDGAVPVSPTGLKQTRCVITCQFLPGTYGPTLQLGTILWRRYLAPGSASRLSANSTRLAIPGTSRIAWSTGTDGKNRLASPLVLKALPLADGRFVPCALWLNRALPKGAKVSVRGVPATECDFDILEAPGDPAKGIAADVAQFPALRGHSTLQAAFHTWLATAKQAKRVAQ